MRIAIEKDLAIPMRDGVVLRADLYCPASDGPFPVLIQRTPYNKDFLPLTALTFDPIRAAKHGYAVLVVDVRGRWASEGDVFFLYRDEFDDGGDTVRWAVAQPWSSGVIGGYGISYTGGCARLMAAAVPAHVRAIATATAPHDFWRNHIWRGGALNLGLMMAWSLSSIGPNASIRTVQRGATPSPLDKLVCAVDAYDEWARFTPIERFAPARPDDRSFLPFFFDVLDHPTPDAFTDSILLTGRPEVATVPALTIAGWHDLLLEADLENYAAAEASELTAERRLVIGPWAHAAFLNMVGELDFGMRANGAFLDGREDLTSLQLRWFDAHLRTVGAADDAPVKFFLQGANVWRDAESWPPRGVHTRDLYLTSDGALSSEPACDVHARTYTFDPENPAPTRGGPILMHAKYVRGPVEQSDWLSRSDVLQFRSNPLEDDLDVIGPVTVTLHAATSGRDTDWIAKLCDVHPNGRVFNVSDGVLRARYADGFERPTLLVPGAARFYTIPLAPTAMRFKRGHRLALLVTSSDFPRYDRNPNTGEIPHRATRFEPALQTVSCGGPHPSRLTLSIG